MDSNSPKYFYGQSVRNLISNIVEEVIRAFLFTLAVKTQLLIGGGTLIAHHKNYYRLGWV